MTLTETLRSDGFSGSFDPRELLLALGFVLGVNLIGSSPALAVGSDTGWIDRPAFYPPEFVFPVAWTLIFTCLGLACYLLYRRGLDRRDVRVAFAVFAVQMVLNLAWTPAFFGLQSPAAGLAVIVPLWAAILVTTYAFARVDRRAAALFLPYIGWVSFAVVLNYAIWVTN
jgi:translocator protein